MSECKFKVNHINQSYWRPKELLTNEIMTENGLNQLLGRLARKSIRSKSTDAGIIFYSNYTRADFQIGEETDSIEWELI